MLTLTLSPIPVLRIRATGRLTAADYRCFEPAFAAELARRQLPVPLLLDMRGFRGWTIGGFLRDLRWDLRHRRTFSKIAVIGDAAWHAGSPPPARLSSARRCDTSARASKPGPSNGFGSEGPSREWIP